MRCPATPEQRSAANGSRLRGLAQQSLIVVLQRFSDQDHPWQTRVLRACAPILRIPRSTPSVTLVTRHEDVLHILEHPESFVAPFGPRLPGDFIAGVDGPKHERYVREMRAVIRDGDPDRIRDLTTPMAEDAIRRARAAGTMDVGAELVQPIYQRIIADYLGLSGLDAARLWQWTEDIFENIFLNFANWPAIQRRADVANAQFQEQVSALIATAKQRPGDERFPADSVLRRMIERQSLAPSEALSDAEMATGLIGLAIGWLWHGARTALIVVDSLLSHPRWLALARAAATAPEDDDQLRRVLWEVLRFRPVQQFIPRICEVQTAFDDRSGRPRTIRRGELVLAGTQSAMHDARAIPSPETFDSTRADTQYLIFGWGSHACPGEPITRLQLPAMLRPLLEIENLTRADTAAGRLTWHGPRAIGLSVAVPR